MNNGKTKCEALKEIQEKGEARIVGVAPLRNMILVVCLGFALSAYGVSKSEVAAEVAVSVDMPDYYEGADEDGIFVRVEKQAEFKGGFVALKNYIKENLIYPKVCYDNGIKGRVFVSFVVETDGRITGIKVVRGIHKLLDKEAVRLVKRMPR